MTRSGDRAVRILSQLMAEYPHADTELVYRNAYELLVATILSAQCTDVRVNAVTPALFDAFPDAKALAGASPDVLEPLVRTTGFFRSKARSLIGMASALTDRHGGTVPSAMDDLVALPGVGRKTASVVLGHALGVPALPVDRHVLRVANRLALSSRRDPEAVEEELRALWPPHQWRRASDSLILHGRRVCMPRPHCDRCVVRPDCPYANSVHSE